MMSKPAVPCSVSSPSVPRQLPPGQVMPNPLEIERAPSLGGYRVLQIVAGVVWVLGLLAIVYYGFLRRKKHVAQEFEYGPLGRGVASAGEGQGAMNDAPV